MPIFPRGTVWQFSNLGIHAIYNLTGFTQSALSEGDKIEDSEGIEYVIKTVEPNWWLNHFVCYTVELEKIEDGAT